MFIIEYSENTKEHKMTTKIIFNSTILRNQTFGILSYYYIWKIFARLSYTCNFITFPFCLYYEQFYMSLHIIQKHVFNDYIILHSTDVV